MKKIICKIFGHKWREGTYYSKVTGKNINAIACDRCNKFKRLLI